MRITIVDDERRARQILENILRSLGEEDIIAFPSAEEALAHVRRFGCDLAFLDIEMPGMSGMELTAALAALPEPPMTVFVTAYPEYSLRAWDLDAADYLLKPFSADRIRRALERARRRLGQKPPKPPQVEVRCFPTFGLWVNGTSVDFGNRKARELLAYLVHMQGEWASMDSIIFALFEDRGEKSAKDYYRQVLHRLKATLRSAGVENMVQSAYGKVRVAPSTFSCDYYRYLKGEKELFFGEYLADYSWAEPTLADLRRRG